MGLALTTPPATEPISLDEAKLHLRVSINDDDDLIDALIRAARGYVEEFTHRALITQSWRLTLDTFPDREPLISPIGRSILPGLSPFLGSGVIDMKDLRRHDLLPLPRPNLLSVASVAYVDSDGNPATMDPDLYTVDTSELPGRIALAYGACWPTPRCQRNAVTIDFTAGYGDASTVPPSIMAAMKLLVGHLYENREAVVLSRYTVAEVPFTIDALLGPFRVMEF